MEYVLPDTAILNYNLHYKLTQCSQDTDFCDDEQEISGSQSIKFHHKKIIQAGDKIIKRIKEKVM